MICLHEEETKGMPFLPKYQPLAHYMPKQIQREKRGPS